MKPSHPPRLPEWLLTRFCRSMDNEAVVGDLTERYLIKCSRWWYWKQVLITISVGALPILSQKGNLFMKRAALFTSLIAGVFLLGFWLGRNPIFQTVEVPTIDQAAIYQRSMAKEYTRVKMDDLYVQFLRMQLSNAVADGANDSKSQSRIRDLEHKLFEAQRKADENKR